MKRKAYIFLIECVCFVNLLFFDLVHSQFKEGENFFISGIINEMGWDRNSIVISGKTFILSSETKIVDQRGNKLTKEEIRPHTEVSIDACRSQKSFLIKKIVIIKDRGV